MKLHKLLSKNSPKLMKWESLNKKKHKLAKVKVLIIDELGYCPFSAYGSHVRQYETTSTNECKNVDLPCKL